MAIVSGNEQEMPQPNCNVFFTGYGPITYAPMPADQFLFEDELEMRLDDLNLVYEVVGDIFHTRQEMEKISAMALRRYCISFYPRPEWLMFSPPPFG